MPYPDNYPPIAEHGLIGDLQTAALVTTGGSIDWFCCPRFDSPSVFAALLDRNRGGYFRIAPEPGTDGVTRKQWYFHDTAVLMTRFMTADGVGSLYDFMPVRDGAATDTHEIVRVLRVVRGTMRFVVECRPRFDYGRARHTAETTPDGVVLRGPDLELCLHTVVDGGGALDWVRDGDDVRAVITLTAGQAVGVVLESGHGLRPRRIPIGEADERFESTVGFWRAWLERSTYVGRWREHRRVGRYGEPFELWKLRTMVSGAEPMGAGLYIEAGDARITRVGAMLRRFSLDELPNLVNVLRGEMSIVGPRPTVAVQVDRYTRPPAPPAGGQAGHHRVGPGQRPHVDPWPERIELDVWYVDHRSVRLDLRILARTVKLLATGQGLYSSDWSRAGARTA